VSYTILNGKELANSIQNKVKKEVKELSKKYGRPPKISVIIVGNDFSSNKYVSHKINAANYCGIESEIINLDEKTTTLPTLEKKINELSNNNAVDAILIQFPLPKWIHKRDVMKLIPREKDADGFNPFNIGCLAQDSNSMSSACTPKGVMYIFKKYNIDLEGKTVVIVGRSQIVGRPMALMMLNSKATTIITHRYTKNLASFTSIADIIISATGIPNLIKADMVKDNAIIIDIGISRDKNDKLSGDVDFKNVSKKVKYITPVPGGVGPMTVATLMENTLSLYKQRIFNKNY